MVEPTDEQRRAYMDNPEACPVCGSYDLETQETSFYDKDLYQRIFCNDCQASWGELYVLTGLTHLELKDEDEQVQKQTEGQVQIELGDNGG